MAYDLTALSSYVKFYLTVLSQLDGAWKEIARAHDAVRDAMEAFRQPLLPAGSSALAACFVPAPAAEIALAGLWRPTDAESLSGMTDVYEVAGRFTFQGPDDDNLSSVQVLVATARNELHLLRARLADLGRLPDAARGTATRQADDEARICANRRAARAIEFGPLAQTLAARARQTMDAVKAVPPPDVRDVEIAKEAYQKYVVRVQQVYDTCRPFLHKAVEALYAFVNAEAPPSWPETLPLVAELPAELIAIPPADSPELSGARRALTALGEEERALTEAQAEIAAALTRLDGDIAAESTKEAEARQGIAASMSIVDQATAAADVETASRAITSYEQQRAARHVTIGEIRARHQMIEAAIVAMDEELRNRALEIQNLELGLTELKEKEPLVFGKEEWRGKVAGLESDIEKSRATYNQRLAVHNQLKIDLSALSVQSQTEEGQIKLLDRWISDTRAKRDVHEARLRNVGESLGPVRPARPLSVADAEAGLLGAQTLRAEIVERIERQLANIRRYKEDAARGAARQKQIEIERQRMSAMVETARVLATQGRDAALRQMAVERAGAVERHITDVLSGLEKSLLAAEAVFVEPARDAMTKLDEPVDPESAKTLEAAEKLAPVVEALERELDARLLEEDARLSQIQREFCDVAPSACIQAWG